MRSKTFWFEREARQHPELRESEAVRAIHVDVDAGKVPFADWAAPCMGIFERQVSRSSYARDCSYLANHALPR